MSINVECSSCGSEFRVKDAAAGKTIPCRECGANVRVPAARGGQQRKPQGRRGSGGMSVASDFDTPDDYAPRSSRRDSGGGMSRGAIIGISVGGGVLALAILGLVLYNVVAKDETPQATLANTQTSNQVQPGFNQQNRQGFNQPNPNPQPFRPVNTQQPARPKVWNVQPDPHVVEIQEADGQGLRIPADAFSFVVYPEQPSHFVSLSGGNTTPDPYLASYDLKTGEKVGQISGRFSEHDRGSLSPDGKLYLKQATGGQGKTLVEVLSFHDGSKQEIEVDARSRSIRYTGFVANDRAVVIFDKNEEGGSAVALIDMNSKRKVQEFLVPRESRWNDIEGIAFSPGGKYLAMLGDQLIVYDLQSGSRVGDVAVPEHDERNRWNCPAMTFSPDGKELAMVIERFGKTRLMNWDVTSGEILKDHHSNEIPQRRFASWPFFKGKKIRWFPDQQHWLIAGNTVVDKNTGNNVYVFNRESQFNEKTRVIFDADRVLVMEKSGADQALITASVPRGSWKQDYQSEPERNQPSFNPGNPNVANTEPQVPLPELTKVDLKNTPKLTLLEGFADWQVQPDPIPSSDTPLLKDPFPIMASSHRKVLFSSPQAARAVVLHSTEDPHRWGRPSGPQSAWLESYDLIKGGSVGRVDVPFGSELLDVSPSGELALLRIGENRDRIDVWSLAEGKHLGGMTPYAQEEGQIRTRSSFGSTSVNSVRWGGFLDNRHLVTINHAKGKMVLWEVPGFKPVYTVETGTNTPVFFTPGRQYVCMFEGMRLRFLDALTGQVKGDMSVPFDTTTAEIFDNLIAFNTDGTKLALVAQGPAVSVLLHWDLTIGKFVAEFPLDKLGETLEWCSNSHLLFSNNWRAYLVDVERNAIVWSYVMFHSELLGRSPDHRQWMLISHPSIQEMRYLAGLEFSDQQVLTEVDQKFPKNLPPLVGPGMSVSLDLGGLSNNGGNSELTGKIDKHLRDLLQGNQVTVNPSAPIKLVVSSQSGESETVQYEIVQSRFPGMSIGGSPTGQVVSVNIETIKCRVAYVNAQGETIWERSANLKSGYLGSWVNIPQNEDPSSYLNRKANEGKAGYIESFFMGTRLPRVVYQQPKDDKGNLGLGFKMIDLRKAIDFNNATSQQVTSRAQQQFEQGYREYLLTQYAEALKAEESQWDQMVKWIPGLNRPVVHNLRIGLAAETNGKIENAFGPTIADQSALQNWGKAFGPIGQKLADEMQKHFDQAKWPDWKDARMQKMVVFPAGNRRDVIQGSRKMGLDLVIVISLEVERLRGGQSQKMQVYLWDVHRGQKVWSSNSVSEKQLQQQGPTVLAELAEAALIELDERYKPIPLPTLTTTAVQERKAELEKMTSYVNPLAVLLELRLLQAKELLIEQQTIPFYQKILGDEPGREFATADPEKRKEILDQALPTVITREP